MRIRPYGSSLACGSLRARRKTPCLRKMSEAAGPSPTSVGAWVWFTHAERSVRGTDLEETRAHTLRAALRSADRRVRVGSPIRPSSVSPSYERSVRTSFASVFLRRCLEAPASGKASPPKPALTGAIVLGVAGRPLLPASTGPRISSAPDVRAHSHSTPASSLESSEIISHRARSARAQQSARNARRER